MITLEQDKALADALAELERNYDVCTSGVTVLFVGAESVRESLRSARMSINVLSGDLLDAARGLRPWPLDEGAKIDTAGALGAWLHGTAGDLAEKEILLVLVALVAAAYLVSKVAR